MLIYLIRHLTTRFNQTGIYMGRQLDPPILKSTVPLFRRTLTNTRLAIPDKKLILLFSSPLKRCQETSALVKEQLQLTTLVQSVEEFNETDYGGFSNKTLAKISELYPELSHVWLTTPSQITFPEGESYQEVQERAYHKLSQILKLNSSSTVFIVTHVDIIKLLICRVLSFSIDKKAFFRIDNGSITCLQSFKGGLRLNYLNFV